MPVSLNVICMAISIIGLLGIIVCQLRLITTMRKQLMHQQVWVIVRKGTDRPVAVCASKYFARKYISECSRPLNAELEAVCYGVGDYDWPTGTKPSSRETIRDIPVEEIDMPFSEEELREPVDG